MNFLMTLFVGLATLVWGGFASMPQTRDVPWTNTTSTTITAIVGYSTQNPSGSPTSTSTTTSAEPSVYTIPFNYTVPGNRSVDPIRWDLYNIQAVADRETQTAHYSFQAVLQPNLYTAVCNGTAHAWNGQIDGVDNTECKAMSLLIPKNGSIPITFHFAWRHKASENLGKRRELLVLKSNSPGSAHACPNPPYDACWAQGLYWIPEHEIKPTDAGHRYIGPRTVHLNGTYCRTGMPECFWSEYLY